MSQLDSLTKEEVLTDKSLGGLKVTRVEQRAPFINLLVYGPPGVGKTVLAGSASDVAEMSPVLFIDIEGGTFSLRKRYPDVDVVRVEDWKAFQKLYLELRKGDSGYKTLVMDSLTEIQKYSMYLIMQDLIKSDPDRDPDVPGMREWGKNTEQIRRTVRAFRDLPLNCIFTALSATDRDNRGVTMTKPSLSGKLSGEVAGFVDIVAYMYVKMVEGSPQRLLLTSGTDKEIAKDRRDKLPTIMHNPTMTDIHNNIFEGEPE